MDLFAWVVVGFLAGAVARWIVKDERSGCLYTTSIGVIGALIGGGLMRGAGIDIPAETLFVAAQHDTAVDRVTLLDRHLVPAEYRADLDRLDRDLERAGAALAAERCEVLPGVSGRLSARQAARHVSTRSTDWAQVYPEWGLAGNAAFIVAPREVTAGLDLQRRTFLHSYVAEVDSDGSALETILTAPLAPSLTDFPIWPLRARSPARASI